MDRKRGSMRPAYSVTYRGGAKSVADYVATDSGRVERKKIGMLPLVPPGKLRADYRPATSRREVVVDC